MNFPLTAGMISLSLLSPEPASQAPAQPHRKAASQTATQAAAQPTAQAAAHPPASRRHRMVSGLARKNRTHHRIQRLARRITVLEWRHGGCLGPCPQVRVRLSRSGKALYVGKAYSARIGTYDGHVDQVTFDRIARLMVASGFFHMKHRYRSRLTCQALQEIRVEQGSKWFSVTESGMSGPDALWGLFLALDQVASRIHWHKRGTPQRAPQAPSAFLQAFLNQVNTSRRQRRHRPLRRDPNLSSWAHAMAGAHPDRAHGTMIRVMDHPPLASIQSCGIESAVKAAKRLTKRPTSPLLDPDFRRLGLAASWMDEQGAWCLQVFLAR